MSKVPPASFGDICFNGFKATHKTWLIFVLCGRSLREFPSCLISMSHDFTSVQTDILPADNICQYSNCCRYLCLQINLMAICISADTPFICRYTIYLQIMALSADNPFRWHFIREFSLIQIC